MRMKKPSSKKCQSRSKLTWKSTILPVRNGFMACRADHEDWVCGVGGRAGRTERTTLATSAQKKLRHIVLIGQLIVISCSRSSRQWREARQDGSSERTSSEKSTPPIGLPKATATPVAEAAVTISRILAESGSEGISIEEFLGMRSPCRDQIRAKRARRADAP